MGPKLDQITVGVCVMALGGALLACKKDEEPAPAASVTAAPAPEPPKEEPKPEEEALADDEAKRYDDETEEKGTVKVKVLRMKIYQEADTSSKLLEEIGRGTLVNRKARRGNYVLIEYPSGPGELSPGWVDQKDISDVIEKIDPEKVKIQDAGKPKAEEKDEDKDEDKEEKAEEKPEDTPKRERRVRLPKKGVAPPGGGRPQPGSE